MERVVTIDRCRKTGYYVAHPLGTFKGYGAYVGINPYKEFPPDVTSETLGQTVMELLDRAVATGFHIKDIEEYRRETSDADTTRIRRERFAGIKSTNDKARRFVSAEVSKDNRHKSLLVVRFRYDKKTKAHEPEFRKRIKLTGGATLLGDTLKDLLTW